MHSYTTHGRNPYRSARLAQMKQASRCSSGTSHPYSSSNSNASSTMRLQVAWSRSTSLSGSHRNSKFHSVRFSPLFPPRGVHFTGPDITVPAARQSAKPSPSRHTLYGVLYHHGMISGGGHYSVDVLHPYGDGGDGEAWLHIDNETVSKVGHEGVFRGHQDERAVDRSAYMLFYHRTSP
jgi:hypothetical protein